MLLIGVQYRRAHDRECQCNAVVGWGLHFPLALDRLWNAQQNCLAPVVPRCSPPKVPRSLENGPFRDTSTVQNVDEHTFPDVIVVHDRPVGVVAPGAQRGPRWALHAPPPPRLPHRRDHRQPPPPPPPPPPPRATALCCTPPPTPCNSRALVQATVGVGTVLIWYLILIRYQM